ncbi:amidase domain-containing protein [Evansella sp. AB-P1]|uniref:amidase domain-containing protein n=1 Tax=Evansella sp. AB-P1 TaxID=3037653 RepID=UPI00241DACE6|nr:amidase domain-containing protein [Evansella sp. AB-P1]MDG5788790.1 amidase domain-containing protein [Evansella sp. AB-P1]
MDSQINKVKRYIRDCHQNFVNGNRSTSYIRNDEMEALERKEKRLFERNAEIVKNIVDGYVISEKSFGDRGIIDYGLTIQNVIRQNLKFYIEEQIQLRRAVVEDDELIDDYLIHEDGKNDIEQGNQYSRRELTNDYGRTAVNYQYDRLAVVRYAERWWNDYNPQYHQFENDCTNYISQCLHAGGAPMIGQPNRSNGWWYVNNNWSYSWSVAHALRWYFSSTERGLQATEVSSPEQLMKGDVICYDFNGDGRWQHTTIVVEKDEDRMPLVNAHTTNSRMRYWAYEDSTAWTPNIKYKFYHILDND